ncbi:MFS transporter [Jatrophihabitans telluris]|uniref:MFS transporter n=1 Tax=Jatrophihabitans telluris TaxID=2038343 RepID=A0ABY4QW58_9ACTN|nr:MFS transporter [Jatrophihabitans telluris]UQX87668.1 MFS transporter [Jatrophihabitans telluris]
MTQTSTVDASPRPSRSLRHARLATALTFAFNGFLYAAWVPHIPEVKAHLGLSDAALGLALLGPGIGSLLSMGLIGRATTRWGSGPVTTVMAFATYLVIIGPGLAFNLPTLFLALVGWGVVTGGLDVAMNAQAVQIEKSYRRPIMSSFHAFWSIGTVVGTGVGSVGAGLHVTLATQQATLAVILTAVTVWSMRQFVGDHVAEEQAEGSRVFEWRLVLLGLAGVCALLAEGSAADWSPVYLRDDLHVAAGHTGIAFLAFTIMMTIGRTIGDRVVLALGRTRSVALLAVIGSIGMSLGLIADTLVVSSIGFACLGFGLSIMVPVFFSTAADGPGAAGPKLAVVSSFSYCGFLLGPAALGPLASASSVHDALWVLPAFAALAGVLGVLAVRMTARFKA